MHNKHDIKTTVDNLRELAKHVREFDADRIDMNTFVGVPYVIYYEDDDAEGGDDYRAIDRDKYDELVIEGGHECNTSCCMLGIAHTKGMGENVSGDYWDLSTALFPVIPNVGYFTLKDSNAEKCKVWRSLFSVSLSNDKEARIKGLLMAADQLEQTGTINIEELPK